MDHELLVTAEVQIELEAGRAVLSRGAHRVDRAGRALARAAP